MIVENAEEKNFFCEYFTNENFPETAWTFEKIGILYNIPIKRGDADDHTVYGFRFSDGGCVYRSCLPQSS